jgi:hypothetical protein
MILQILIAFYGTLAIGAGIGAGIEHSVKGWKANEEKFLQANLDWEKWIEEEKKAKNEIETIRRRRSEWKKCCCEDARKEEQFDEAISCFYHRIFKYAHWIREQLTSAEVQKEELKELVENVQAILKVIEDTYQHEKTEWELNNSKEATQNEDYEIIDKGLVELEQEVAEWQNILTELESRLNNLPNQEQQTQSLQPRIVSHETNEQQTQIIQPETAYGNKYFKIIIKNK